MVSGLRFKDIINIRHSEEGDSVNGVQEDTKNKLVQRNKNTVQKTALGKNDNKIEMCLEKGD